MSIKTIKQASSQRKTGYCRYRNRVKVEGIGIGTGTSVIGRKSVSCLGSQIMNCGVRQYLITCDII